MMPHFWPMFRKEFIQMRRDRLTFAMMVGVPVLQLLVFGYAIQTDVRNLPAVVLDESRTPESREIIYAFQNTGNFRIVGYVDGRSALDRAIARGDAQAAIVVPYQYPRDLARGRTATLQIIVDASDPLASQAAIAAAGAVAQIRNLVILTHAAGRASLPLEARVRPRYNPGLRSPNYIVPGLVGVILTMTMVLITAMAIVRERERGTLEQLIVTPITKTELMLGKIAPYVGVGLMQMTAVLILGRFVFDVPLTGNILLSGFMFPRQAMPEIAQWLGLLVPLTYFLKVVRGILLKGVGLEALWREVLVLAGFAVVLIAASVRRFRKTLD